ncbi:hypothetical protein N0V82_007498 [Gnomoniopsis sp. IMI 355080]|nr:hypothetical protein N0V82_007498 [Gnomoniopsis sp. IMI 355080]
METITKSNVKIVEIKHSLVPKKWEETVRVVGMSECKEVALSLAYAFAADDLACYLLNTNDMADLSPEEKWRLHVDMFTYIVAAHILNGEVHVIGPEYDAVALWLPPGCVMDDWWTLLRSGQWRLWYQLSAEGRQRYYNEMLPLLHHTKMEVLGERDDNAYYLVYLGTKPHARGRGYARKLIQTMTDRADTEKRPVYLESSSLANNAYYRKFGFVGKKDVFLKRGPAPVQLSIMVREPQPPATEITNITTTAITGRKPKATAAVRMV